MAKIQKVEQLPIIFEQPEIWKDIPGYEGRYQASTLGRIKSLDRLTTGRGSRKIKESILTGSITKYGYSRVMIDRKQKLIHRLIALTFIPNPNNLPYVNHINGIKTDNRVENLEWCTQSENMLHAFANGLKKANGRKLTEENVMEIKSHLYYKAHSYSELAVMYKVSKGAIALIAQGKKWKTIQFSPQEASV